MSKVLCIDFDDTLRNKQSDLPMEGAAEAMRILKSKGSTILISSARLDPVLWGDLLIHREKEIAVWLEKHHIPYDKIVSHKPVADIYIDDKAYHFDGNWEKTVLDVIQVLSYHSVKKDVRSDGCDRI
ncbi:MAG: hypothetical protein JXD22_07095 [Sedimentisphaerales bacterium]|nr:hypothetical protein [Sedimentisphaerales bacterium]